MIAIIKREALETRPAAISKDTENTLLNGDQVLRMIAGDYDVGKPINADLIRKGFNHNYYVETDRGQFVLRVYLNGKYYIRGSCDFRFELELLNFLSSKGLPVARPIPNTGNDWLSTVEINGVDRHFALFSFVQGLNAEDALKEGQFRRPQLPMIGRTFALLHQACDSFVCQHHRYHLNLETYLLDEPLRYFGQLLEQRDLGDLEFFNKRADEIRDQISPLEMQKPNYGLIHADLNVENILFGDDGTYTIIDFDHCAYGWRIYDFAVAAFQNPDMRQDFLAGYETVRSFSELEKELIPLFSLLSRIWNHYDIVRFLPLMGEELSDCHLNAFKAELKELL